MSKRQWMALVVVGLGTVTLAASPSALQATSGHPEPPSRAAAPARNPQQAGHPQQIEAQVDAIFSTVYQTRFPVPKITPTGPGCAVGVSVDGKVVISKAPAVVRDTLDQGTSPDPKEEP